jgi:hypothetical protein
MTSQRPMALRHGCSRRSPDPDGERSAFLMKTQVGSKDPGWGRWVESGGCDASVPPLRHTLATRESKWSSQAPIRVADPTGTQLP